MLELSSLALMALALVSPSQVGNWPGWRGPRGDGIANETNLPTQWSATENIAWKAPIPGRGHSSPIVWGDRVFLTACHEDQGKHALLCLDRKTGQILWERQQEQKLQKAIHQQNSHASSTPATDGKRVFVTFHDTPHFVACCYDFDGNLLWKKSPGDFYSRHGFCSAPLLHKNLVILNGDQDSPNGRENQALRKQGIAYDSYLVALDQATGEERWRTKRPHNIRSYTPPLVFDMAGKKQLVLSGSLSVASYEPDTGKPIWIVDKVPTEQYVSSLVYANNLLFLTYGFPKKGYMAIKPDGQGDVTNSHVVYNFERQGGYVPSPIAHGGYFYFVNDEGIASCVEATTGKSQWKERLGKKHHASPISAAGRLYFTDDDGITYVLQPGPEKCDILRKNPLNEECYASPAVSRGNLFIRTLHHLWCVGPTPK